MPLPEACEKCLVTGGYWVESLQGGGMERCGCSRGLALKRRAEAQISRPPVIATEEAILLAEMLVGVYGFSLGQATPLIAAEIRSMCESLGQAKDFIRRFARFYSKWPGGLSEMRWAFCQMGFTPLDAIQPVDDSEIYPNGLPISQPITPPVSALEPFRDPRSTELPPGEAGRVLRAIVSAKRGNL